MKRFRKYIRFITAINLKTNKQSSTVSFLFIIIFSPLYSGTTSNKKAIRHFAYWTQWFLLLHDSSMNGMPCTMVSRWEKNSRQTDRDRGLLRTIKRTTSCGYGKQLRNVCVGPKRLSQPIEENIYCFDVCLLMLNVWKGNRYNLRKMLCSMQYRTAYFCSINRKSNLNNCVLYFMSNMFLKSGATQMESFTFQQKNTRTE